MYYLILLVYLYVIIHPSWCISHACHSLSAQSLNENECQESFDFTEKDRTTSKLRLELRDSILNFTTTDTPWNSIYLSISLYENGTNRLCRHISNDSCVSFSPRFQNQSYLLQYKSPQLGSGKLLFTMPNHKLPLFLYIDIVDLSHLVLRSYLLAASTLNISHVKVQAFKEKNNVTTFLDTKPFSDTAEIDYGLFTYNDEGNYYFVVDAYYSNDSSVRMTTPKVYVGRKRTRLVIGIVGASFILPFVLFVFHILTRKYPESNKEVDSKIAVVYKSSSKKHNEVVTALVTLLQANCRDQVSIELLDLSRSKKTCNSSILFASHVVYVAPPIQDKENIVFNKILSQKDVYTVIFDHCTDNLLESFTNRKVLKLLDDFETLLHVLNLPKLYDPFLLDDLKRKTEEAKVETDLRLNDNVLPKIIVTTSEPEEQEALISPKIVV